MIGNLAVIAGFLGILSYLCLIVIRFSGQSGKLNKASRRLCEANEGARKRLEKTRQECETKTPQLDALVEEVLQLRAERDRWMIAIAEMETQAKGRDIQIKTSKH